MGDKPILFSAPMVRALLAGAKTQTRREIKPRPWNAEGDCVNIDAAPTASVVQGHDRRFYFQFDHPLGGPLTAYVARIAVGDRLWVKETSRITSWGEDGEVWMTYAADETKSRALYPDDEDYLERLCARVERAGAETNADGMYENIPAGALVKPSIFMPRWASRITLRVTDVRVQRLHDISDADAIAEGIERSKEFPDRYLTPAGDYATPTVAYQRIWEAINGTGSWDANPWVAAYTFTVEQANVDQARRAA